MSWIPPIGIPVPDWGGTIGNPIDLARPEPPEDWDHDIAGFYYIESGGSNTNEGYPGNPRNALPLTLGPGTVCFINGTYTQTHDPYYLRHTGTAEEPCWILGYDPEVRTVATGRWIFLTTEYLIVDGIDLDGSGNAYGGIVEQGGGVNHVCFRNMKTTGRGQLEGDPDYESAAPEFNASSFIIQNDNDFSNEQIIWYNIEVTKAGNWLYSDPEADPDAHGIAFGTSCQDMWIVDCTFSYMSGCAVQAGAGTNDSTIDSVISRRIYMGRNTAHHIAQTAFFSKRTNHCIISQNTIHDIRRDTPSSPNAGGVGGQYGPRNIWLIFNTIYACQNAIAIQAGTANTGDTTDTDIYIIGNIVYNIHNELDFSPNWRGDGNTGTGTCVLLRGGLDHYLINNTFYDYDAGVLSPIIGHNRFVEGNIFANRNPSVPGADISFDGGDAGGLNTYKSNIIVPADIDGIWLRNGDDVYTTVTALNAAKGPGNIDDVPDFEDAGAGDFRLATGSAGIDAFGSIAHAVYALFETNYSRSIQVDRSNGIRPWTGDAETGEEGGDWDIGAYEFGSATAPPPPPPPATPTYSAEHHITFPLER